MPGLQNTQSLHAYDVQYVRRAIAVGRTSSAHAAAFSAAKSAAKSRADANSSSAAKPAPIGGSCARCGDSE